MPAPKLPVVIMGEVHTNPEHAQIENGALADLRGLGYDTVAMELPRDYQPAVSKYLQSHHSAKDHEQMEREIMAVDTQSPSAKSITKDELAGYTRMMRHSLDNLSRDLNIAQAAMAEGYKVRLVDVPSAQLAALTQMPVEKEISERNKAMASEIATQVQGGAGVVMITGGAHLNPKMASGSSLQGELSALGVKSENFDLAVNGKSTDVATHVPAAQITAPDHLVSTSAQILNVMRTDLSGGMQRSGMAAQASLLGESLQK